MGRKRKYYKIKEILEITKKLGESRVEYTSEYQKSTAKSNKQIGDYQQKQKRIIKEAEKYVAL